MKSPIFRTLVAIDKALAKKGVPPMSDYWRAESQRFYEHPTAHELIECVGRGGDKTRQSVKMGIAEDIAGGFLVPPGERHYFTHVSENVAEAQKTLGMYAQYLSLLNIRHHRVGDTIELSDAPRGFKVLACRVGAVSGWRSYGWTADECAKWDDEGADPSAEVIASIRAMTITHPSPPRGRMFSSPLSTAGHFFEAWSTGDTAHQLVGHAPSWIGNPSITEARTRELEPHEPTWRREYAAEPGAGSSDAVTADEAKAMVRHVAPGSMALGHEIGLLDSSSGRGDGWAYAFVRYVRDGDRRVLYVSEIGAFEGRFSADASFEAVVAQVANIARARGVVRFFGDQYLSFALQSSFAKFGISYVERAWTQPTKVEALATLRRLLRERLLVVEPGEEGEATRRELVSLREVLLPSKVFTVQARRTGRGHADRASLMLMLGRVVSEGDIIGGEVQPACVDALGTFTQPRAIRTAWGSGLGGGFSSDFGILTGSPRNEPAPRPAGPTQIAVPNGPGTQPTILSIPAPPRFGGGGGGNGSRGWGGW